MELSGFDSSRTSVPLPFMNNCIPLEHSSTHTFIYTLGSAALYLDGGLPVAVRGAFSTDVDDGRAIGVAGVPSFCAGVMGGGSGWSVRKPAPCIAISSGPAGARPVVSRDASPLKADSVVPSACASTSARFATMSPAATRRASSLFATTSWGSVMGNQRTRSTMPAVGNCQRSVSVCCKLWLTYIQWRALSSTNRKRVAYQLGENECFVDSFHGCGDFTHFEAIAASAEKFRKRLRKE